MGCLGNCDEWTGRVGVESAGASWAACERRQRIGTWPRAADPPTLLHLLGNEDCGRNNARWERTRSCALLCRGATAACENIPIWEQDTLSRLEYQQNNILTKAITPSYLRVWLIEVSGMTVMYRLHLIYPTCVLVCTQSGIR